MRSAPAIALCNVLYWSERLRMGSKNCRENWIKAMSTPIVSVPAMACNPPNQMTRPSAVDATMSTIGQKSAK